MAIGLRAELAALDRARAEGSRVIAIESLDLLLRPRHRLDVAADGSWEVQHPHRCVIDCGVAHQLRTAHLLSSPHARGRTYEVWRDAGSAALSFLDVTGREGS